jgi:hypothetical protein
MVKSKPFSPHAMKEASGQLQMPTSLTLEKDPLPTYEEVGWTPEPIWTFWRRENSYDPTQI